MPAQLLPREGAWDFSALEDLPDDGNRYEVVDGNLVVTPPPTQLHQVVSSRLRRAIEETMPDGWEVFTDFSLPLGSDGRIPDLAVVRMDVQPSRSSRNPYRPAAFGLVGEVVSPRTRKTDRFAKPGEYAEAGIPLYWRIELDPEPRIHGYRLRDGAYVEIDGPPPLPWGSLDVSLADLGIG